MHLAAATAKQRDAVQAPLCLLSEVVGLLTLGLPDSLRWRWTACGGGSFERGPYVGAGAGELDVAKQCVKKLVHACLARQDPLGGRDSATDRYCPPAAQQRSAKRPVGGKSPGAGPSVVVTKLCRGCDTLKLKANYLPGMWSDARTAAELRRYKAGFGLRPPQLFVIVATRCSSHTVFSIYALARALVNQV